MRLQDLNWMDVEKYLEKDDRIILVVGSTEQHAYLSLLTDALIPLHIAEAVAKQEKVLIAPPLNFGVSHIFREFPGTITLSKQTFEYVLLEIFESLFHHGFQRFLIINGHGGNEMPERMKELHSDGSDVQILWFNWWKSDAVASFAKKHNLIPEHANWSENFPFNRVAESPKEEKPTINWKQLKDVTNARGILGDGNFGGVYQIEDKLMQELFDLVVEETIGVMRKLADG